MYPRGIYKFIGVLTVISTLLLLFKVIGWIKFHWIFIFFSFYPVLFLLMCDLGVWIGKNYHKNLLNNERIITIKVWLNIGLSQIQIQK